MTPEANRTTKLKPRKIKVSIWRASPSGFCLFVLASIVLFWGTPDLHDAIMAFVNAAAQTKACTP